MHQFKETTLHLDVYVEFYGISKDLSIIYKDVSPASATF